MFKNYIKIACRNIYRQKLYTFVNVIGLSLGLCACMSIYVITSHELSFDNFHPCYKNIYRVMGDLTERTGEILHFAGLPAAIASEARQKLPGTEAAGIIPYDVNISIAAAGQPSKKFSSRLAGSNYITTAICEPQYFSIFSYQWLAGNPATALSAPFSAVITESKARQYFGNIPVADMLGRQIVYSDSLQTTLSGIIKDWDKNTDIEFTDFISSATLQSPLLKNYTSNFSWNRDDLTAWIFFKLNKGIHPLQVNRQMAAIAQPHTSNQFKLALWLDPLTNIHFNADIIESPIRTAHKPTQFALIGIAIFILLLAIVNFINLSTAQSLQRSKEVGVRKVLGSSRTSLVIQFLLETAILTFLSAVLAASLVTPVLHLFSGFIPDGVSFHIFSFSTLLFLLLITTGTALLAGLYPAKILSAYLPVISLKGKAGNKPRSNFNLRKSLIVFQFSVSLVFITGSIVIASQLKFARSKDPGFSAGGIINIDTPMGDSSSNIHVLARQLSQISGVENVALEWLPPMTDNPRGMQLKFKSSDEKEFGATQVDGDENYIPLFRIKLLAGRNLQKADSVKELVINESLLHYMGLQNPSAAIGKILYWRNRPYPVVGVVADFHTQSMHDPIHPLCIINRPDREGAIAVKFSSATAHSVISEKMLLDAGKIWKQLYPGTPFNYRFYDETLNNLYEKDRQQAILINSSMGITIFISAIGLFGLSLYSTEKRSKEISIRKILGATAGSITVLLSKDFLLLVIIALLVATPVSAYLMHQWLQNFAYHINLSWWMFVAAGAAAIVVALVTVSFQSVKAAIANPVNSLRSE